jgi:TPR repeat protein
MNRIMKISLGSILALAFLAFSSVAKADLQAGIDAYVSGNYPVALTEFTTLAQNKNAEAQYILGIMYVEGKAVPQDYQVAMSWYRKAAEQGHASAQNTLGAMYGKGLGVPLDYQTAMSWYLKAAEKGDLVAQNNLGFMYINGQGVPADLVQAHMWFSLAAAAGNKNAKENMKQAEELMTPSEVKNAEELARSWSAKHK